MQETKMKGELKCSAFAASLEMNYKIDTKG